MLASFQSFKACSLSLYWSPTLIKYSTYSGFSSNIEATSSWERYPSFCSYLSNNPPIPDLVLFISAKVLPNSSVSVWACCMLCSYAWIASSALLAPIVAEFHASIWEVLKSLYTH